MSEASPHPDVHRKFYDLALQYYVAGRAALACHCPHVPGNLFHHAVEMLLKGQLSKTVPMAVLKNSKKFGHDLQPLWSAFKKLFPNEGLDEFDPMIDGLNTFEDIRYPDKILEKGAVI